jgi:glyoxylase-like metal-dependent hydrolase (beta-lactamase superfamily II)
MLIDSRVGHADPDDPRHLLDQLRAENITPESIDTVVISHYHLDHIGGLLDNAGNPTFSKARSVVPSQEHAHWMHEDILAGIYAPPGFAKRSRRMWSG